MVWTVHASNLGRDEIFSPLQNIQKVSEAHPASYTTDSFPKVKAALA
jgi:hypothetical protein